jgi:hypothetical protein
MPARWSVLHVINGLTRGGASQALSALANVQARQRDASIGVLSLTPADPAARSLLGGPVLLDRPRWADVHEHVGRADIVHAHVWNAPEIFEFLRRPWPSARLVLWFHVASRAAPQRIPRSLLGQADALVASASASLAHPPFATAPATEVVVPARDVTPFLALERSANAAGCACGHVGSLDPMRLPKDLLDWYARPALGEVSFDFAGGGPLLRSLKAAARRLGMDRRARFHGPVSDVRAFLRDCAIFASPHGPASYATSDMSVEEAMAAALPSVLLNPEGTSDLVQDGVTGFVSNSPETYVATLAALAKDGTLRNMIGRQARECARDLFRPEVTARQFQAIYERVRESPPGANRQNLRPVASTSVGSEGAEALIFALGEDHPQFAQSLEAEDGEQARQADGAILGLGGAIWNAAQGGVRHYLSRHPRDPWLSFWSGLGHLAAGAPVHALEAFRKAADCGLPAGRLAPFERQALAALGRAGSRGPS